MRAARRASVPSCTRTHASRVKAGRARACARPVRRTITAVRRIGIIQIFSVTLRRVFFFAVCFSLVFSVSPRFARPLLSPTPSCSRRPLHVPRRRDDLPSHHRDGDDHRRPREIRRGGFLEPSTRVPGVGSKLDEFIGGCAGRSTVYETTSNAELQSARFALDSPNRHPSGTPE